MGRPSTNRPTKTVAFRLEPELIEFLKFMCEWMGYDTISQALVHLVRNERQAADRQFRLWQKKNSENDND